MCPNCRAFISSDDRICPYCDAPIGPRATERRSPGDLFGVLPANKMVTGLLIFVNLAFYLGVSFGSSQMFVMSGAKILPRIANGEWWRLITAGYLHVAFTHILMNMMGLWNLGPLAEELFGSKRLFAIYTVSTITGFALSSVWSPLTPSIGASAGIFGVLGALIAYGTMSGSYFAQELKRQCMINAAIGIAIGFLGFFPIDNAAHLGGLIGGFLCARLAGTPRLVDDTKENIWSVAAIVCLLITLYSFFQLYLKISSGPFGMSL
jgi:rhomboid protease GluP